MTGSGDTYEQLVEYLRFNPDATTPGALGAVDADPTVWVDVLEDALATDEPHESLVRPQSGGSGAEEPAPRDVTPTPDTEETPSPSGVWGDAEFTAPEPGVFPSSWGGDERWMCHTRGDKKPYAPWADSDHPRADDDDDARWKWGIADNYADLDTAREWATMDPTLGGVTYLLREAGEARYSFIDGDDVRCPETGEVHPEFVRVLERLGATYADVSVSGTGVHAPYVGQLPDGVKEVCLAIDDEPWGENDALPEIEIYDHKHVCVTTGEHVAGTPTEIKPWDEDALESLLDEHGQLADPEPENPALEHDNFDPTEYDADATSSDETTTDVRDVFAALEALDARRVAARTIVHSWNDSASTSEGKRAFVPTWGPNANGTANVVDRQVWQDTGGGGYGGPVAMALIDGGEVSPNRATPRVKGETWWNGVEHLRELGFDIPEYEPADGAEHTAVLPENPALDTATSGWDWKHAAGQDDAAVSIDAARERTVDAIADAYTSGDRTLIEALPTMGKSYGAIKAAADTDEQITVLTGRGRKEQYGQFKKWCDEFGLEYAELPSFTHDCPTAAGDHGDDIRETVMDWYNRGATPQEIHNVAEYALGHPLPCQIAEDGQHIDCEYRHTWNFDPDDYDVLIGHYTHAHTQQVTEGRAVVFDEFPDAYETELGVGLQGAISYWLSTVDVPFEDYTDLIENRDDEQRRADALLWFEDNDVEPDERHVFDDGAAHAATPLAVFTLLASDDLGNGFEHAGLDEYGTGVFNRNTGTVSLLQPPQLGYESSLVALDGTPTKRMWELTLGTRLNHRPVLQDEERADYIREALNLNLVRTTDAVKPYNSAGHVATAQDAALLEGVGDAHGQRPSVISSRTALEEYDVDGVLEFVDETKHYGNVLGSNEFESTRLGAVIGSNHYGDHYIKKWGGYAGVAVDRNDEKGRGLSYGDFGDRVLQHMREHDTLQAAMRFGRDGNGAVVYVHTDTLPDWVPLAGEGRVVTTWSDGMRDVLAALDDVDGGATAEIVDHPAVGVGRRQVLDHLETLRERGVLSREQDDDDGRRVVWNDDGLQRVNEHGEVDFDEVSLDDLDEEEVAELARSSNYTWEFRNSPGDTDDGPPADATSAPPQSATVLNGTVDPPNGAD